MENKRKRNARRNRPQAFSEGRGGGSKKGYRRKDADRKELNRKKKGRKHLKAIRLLIYLSVTIKLALSITLSIYLLPSVLSPFKATNISPSSIILESKHILPTSLLVLSPLITKLFVD